MLAYRFLFTQLVRRELRQKYKGSVLGILWYLVNPLVMMGAYTLMFGVIFKLQSIHDFPLFLMVGLSVWTFFQTSLTAGADSLILQGSLLRKARFPREAIPAATVTVQLVTLTAVLALVTILTLAIRSTWSWWLVLVPVLLLALYLFVLGLALAVSVLHAYFRDVLPIISAGLLPLFFLTPIYFNADTVAYVQRHPWVGTLLNWVNPVAPFIEALRAIIYGGASPGVGRIIYTVAAAALSLLLGRLLFTRMQGELAVVL
jgi:ABC-type polysaccharide/polyol phosphate export permease